MNDDIQTINRHDVANVGHYSHCCAAQGLIFVSGQLPATDAGDMLNGESFARQTRQVFHNLDRCLQQAGVSAERLVMVRVYLSDIHHWDEFNRLYAAWLPHNKPARAVIAVSRLHHGVAIEIEAIAAAGSR